MGKHVKFPITEEEMLKCMNLMDELWQSTCAFAAVDGCHIAVKCPSEGQKHTESSIISRTSIPLS